MRSGQGVLLFVLSAMVVSGAWAGGKKINGLSFELQSQPKPSCSLPFYVWHEPDPFFEGLKQVKNKGSVQFRRGDNVVTNFPDSTTLIVEVITPESGTGACPAPPFDPSKVRFNLEWRNDGQTVPATGDVVVADKSSRQNFCEDRCVAHWRYELRIDSQNVPLGYELMVRIETREGHQLAQYLGKLTDKQSSFQMPPFVAERP